MAHLRPAKGREAVLEVVKREGPISADDTAERLGVTAMAVRQHLYGLEKAGEATYNEDQRPRGRPVKLWRVTANADGHFADGHAALASDLIAQTQKAFGEQGLETLLKLRNVEMEKAYTTKTDQLPTLKAKLEALAKIRSSEGYMAEVKRVAGQWVFVENHCPIGAAARLCSGLCRQEAALFQRVLGKNVKIERLTHILAGAERCAYRIARA